MPCDLQGQDSDGPPPRGCSIIFFLMGEELYRRFGAIWFDIVRKLVRVGENETRGRHTYCQCLVCDIHHAISASTTESCTILSVLRR